MHTFESSSMVRTRVSGLGFRVESQSLLRQRSPPDSTKMLGMCVCVCVKISSAALVC